MKLKPFLTTAICFLVLLSGTLISHAQVNNRHINEAPFELHKNLIFVEVRINGQGPFNMMLDTGTDPSAIDLTTAKQIGLKLQATGQKAAGGGTGSNEIYDVEPINVTVGKLKAKNIEIAAADLSAISKALGKPMHGVLGHSFLNNRVIRIDYPKRLVRFYSKPTNQALNVQSSTANRTVLPFRYANESILIQDVEVNGRRVTTLFDTGLNGFFAVMPAAISNLNLEEEFKDAKSAKSAGFSGASTTRMGKVGQVKIGNISVESPSVVFWEKGTGHDTTSYGFTIGNGFLKDFVVTIDYLNNMIIIEKQAS